MKQEEISAARRVILKSLAFLYHDEIKAGLFEAMTSPDFLGQAKAGLDKFVTREISKGLQNLILFLETEGREAHFLARAEYADLFLNAGPNPVHPYESVFASKEPITHGQPLFDMRATLYRAELHKDPDYSEPEDHLAVQLDFLFELSRLAPAGDPKVAEARIDFARRWNPWFTEFCDALEAADRSGFYRGLAQLTRGCLLADQAAASAADENPPGVIDDLALLAQILEPLPVPRNWSLLRPGQVEPRPEETIPSHCYGCGALCGLTAKLKDGVLTGVSGLSGDPKGGGRLCPKGAAAPAHVYSAYRLKAPLIKEKGRFRQATWDEALDRMAEGIKSLDPAELGYFRGNDWCSWVHEALFDHLGCPKTTHRPMCDNSNRMANEHNLNDKRPWINYQDADYILHFGMNELATSYGQRKTAQLRAALDRGAKLVVFDPRRSETAAAATEWIPIRPDTDAAAALAMAYVIIKNELYDREFVLNWTYGFEEFKKRVLGEEDGRPRDPKWAAEISGVPAETLERLAIEFAKARYKGAISWTGAAQVPNGMYATAAVQALNALGGTFDAPGGPSLPFKRQLSSAWGEGQEKPPAAQAPKLDKFTMWSGWAPALFPQDVEAGKLRGLICYFGDPVLSWGNQAATSKALEKLEFKAAVDVFMSNTAIICDLVLPDATWLEQSQVKEDWLYQAFIAYYAEVVRPLYNSRPMYWITIELAKRLGLGRYFPWTNIQEAFQNQLRGLPCTLEELKEKGFVVTDEAEYYKYKKWGGFNPPAGYSSSGRTQTGKYNFLNPAAREKGIDPLPDYHPAPDELRPDVEYPFLFGNFRVLHHEHTSTFNNFRLMKVVGSNPLWINKLDAQELDIEEGDRVKLESPWGRVEMTAHPTWRIMRGVLGSAGGFGHIRGLEADSKYPQFGGINVPGIGKPNQAEPHGGTTLLKYIKCRVGKIET